ncbi:MAG: OB-fold domain-containing protein [Methylobacterium sp.]|uniref:Zn-ribbon domain-containing OB-fold protein n=1 Tax=Methylobacterium sp. TaxID=409 RepID=UPI00258B9DB8|nr:OB-fold domain-containing protein [Methylobacterium sp.]MBY0296192.1 OB-fold domain-containing protein [Methylobacterium sp.]
MSHAVADWTRGEPGLAYQECRACGQRWTFARRFCPACGATEVETRAASGRGTVHALTTVARAPSAALRPHAPYTILLVDAAEGFRLMAHGEGDLAIGDSVTARFAPFGEGLVPVFRKDVP